MGDKRLSCKAECGCPQGELGMSWRCPEGGWSWKEWGCGDLGRLDLGTVTTVLEGSIQAAQGILGGIGWMTHDLKVFFTNSMILGKIRKIEAEFFFGLLSVG